MKFPRACESESLSRSVQALTAAAARGESNALAQLFRSRFDDMYAEARRVTGRDESFCLDVVQDAMIRVMRSLKPVESEAMLQSWLRVVVQSCAFDRLRNEINRRIREQPASVRNVRFEDGQELKEKLDWLDQELKTMKEPHTRLLLLRYRLGWTLQRIGETLGLRPGAVDGRLRRLTAVLRRRAKEVFDE